MLLVLPHGHGVREVGDVDLDPSLDPGVEHPGSSAADLAALEAGGQAQVVGADAPDAEAAAAAEVEEEEGEEEQEGRGGGRGTHGRKGVCWHKKVALETLRF